MAERLQESSTLYPMALLLGLVSAVGPVAIDMYLPALPAIGASLDADPATVQASLAVYFAVLAATQLVYGSLSDRIGRKGPLCAGLALFVIGSIGCAMASSVEALLGFRALQAAGAGAVVVLPRAVVRDLYTGSEAAQLTGLLMLVFSVSPILAPVAGSAVVAIWGWRAIFWIVATAGLAALIATLSRLPETCPVQARTPASLSASVTAYLVLLHDVSFMRLTLIGTFGLAAFFLYLASSAFVMIDRFGVSPTTFGLLFGLNAIAFVAAAQLSGWLAARHGLPGVTRVAAAGFASVLGLLALFVWIGAPSLTVLTLLTAAAFAFLGLILPSSTIMAMETQGRSAGAASALIGAMQMAGGAIIVALAGWLFDDLVLGMSVGMAFCGAAVMALSFGLRDPPR